MSILERRHERVRTGEDRDGDVIGFLQEVVRLGQERGLSLVHEDSHGAFEVLPYDDRYEHWLLSAHQIEKKTPDDE